MSVCFAVVDHENHPFGEKVFNTNLQNSILSMAIVLGDLLGGQCQLCIDNEQATTLISDCCEHDYCHVPFYMDYLRDDCHVPFYMDYLRDEYETRIIIPRPFIIFSQCS